MARFKKKITNPTKKRCTKCGAMKGLGEFYRDKAKKDGLDCWCRGCTKAHRAKPEVIARNKAYKKAYNAKPEVKARNKARDKEFHQAPAKFATYAAKLERPDYVVRKDPQDKKLLQVKCALCFNWFNPTNQAVFDRLDAINGTLAGDCLLYCSQACRTTCPVFGQQTYRKGERPACNPEQDRPDQAEWRDHVINCAGGKCQICGEILEEGGAAHHLQSVIRNPLESADINNGIFLCVECHKRMHKDINCRPADLRCAA